MYSENKIKFKTEADLLVYAQNFVGLTVGELAQQRGLILPEKNLNAKGWGGLVLELLLGTTAGNLALPDFDYLGVELKSIPVDELARPLESTYISIVPLTHFIHIPWQETEVYLKLRRILWIPLITHKKQPVAERIIGQPFLWSPNELQMLQLQQDWQELMDKVAMGELETLTSSLGVYLQIRPKAAHGGIRSWGINHEGKRAAFLPRGFYLRASFTRQILLEQYVGKNI